MEQAKPKRESAFEIRQRKQKAAHEKRKQEAAPIVLTLYNSGQHSQKAIERETGIPLRMVRAVLIDAGLHTVKEQNW